MLVYPAPGLTFQRFITAVKSACPLLRAVTVTAALSAVMVFTVMTPVEEFMEEVHPLSTLENVHPVSAAPPL